MLKLTTLNFKKSKRFSERQFDSFHWYDRQLEYLLHNARMFSATHKHSNDFVKWLFGIRLTAVPGERYSLYLSTKWRNRLYKEYGRPMKEVTSEVLWQ